MSDASKLTDKQKRFYVYMLIDPRTNQPFYVGKGTGRRAYWHERQARRRVVDNAPKYSVIRSILDAGLTVTVEMVAGGLSECDALKLERSRIAATGGLTNISLGVCSNEEKTQIEARDMLSRLKTYDHWISSISEEMRDQVTRVFGDSRDYYDKFAAQLKQLAAA